MPVGHRSVLGAFVPEAARSTHARHLTMAMHTHHTPTMQTASQKCYQVITGTSSKDVHEYFWTHKKALDIEEQHNFKTTLLRWSGMNYSKRRCQISRDDVKSEIGLARNPCTQSTSDIAGLAWTPLRCVWSTLLCNSSQHLERHCGCICRSSAPPAHGRIAIL